MPGTVAMDYNGEVAVLRHFWQCQTTRKMENDIWNKIYVHISLAYALASSYPYIKEAVMEMHPYKPSLL